MSVDIILLILRILLVILLYLFLMQIVIVINRDLRRRPAAGPDDNKRAAQQVLGNLVFMSSDFPTPLVPGTRFPLQPVTTIGRGPTNTIRLTESFISGEHTRLSYNNGTWRVEDPGSANGTFVNDVDVRPQPLLAKPGDILKIGYITFKLIA